MTEIEVLQAAQRIVANIMPKDETELRVYRDTLTGLLWARCDATIAQYAGVSFMTQIASGR